MRVGIATDHGGFSLKEELVEQLRAAGHEVVDFGAHRLNEGDDYPDYVLPLAQAVAAEQVERGVAICGSGVGASVCANKIRGVRAALVHDHFSARQGVPFYIRAGKSLPVTCTEMVVRLREPPIVFPTCSRARNYFRFRVSPNVTAAFGVTVMDRQEKMIGEQVELLASRYPGAEETDAYERVLGDAMTGDATLFAREDYVEEAWRIVDPVLKAGTPVYEYESGTWGPSEVNQKVSPPGGWENPIVGT